MISKFTRYKWINGEKLSMNGSPEVTLSIIIEKKI